jgi:hypothetical protein
MLTWVGGGFDTDHFDLPSVNESLSFIAARRLRSVAVAELPGKQETRPEAGLLCPICVAGTTLVDRALA